MSGFESALALAALFMLLATDAERRGRGGFDLFFCCMAIGWALLALGRLIQWLATGGLTA